LLAGVWGKILGYWGKKSLFTEGFRYRERNFRPLPAGREGGGEQKKKKKKKNRDGETGGHRGGWLVREMDPVKMGPDRLKEG